MSTDFEWESIEASEVFEGIAAVFLAPVVLPLTSAVNQPFVKSALKEGIAFSERCQEAVAEAREQLEDTFAEAQAEVSAERNQSHASSDASSSEETALVRRQHSAQRYFGEQSGSESTQTADQLKDAVNELNAQIRWITNDLLDLRILFSAGLSAFAIRQLIVRGLCLEEIPWYAVAWYALDTFVKFHPEAEASEVTPQSPPTINVESSV